MVLRGMEFGDEVHLECASKLGRSAEGEVDVLAEHLGDVGARDLHPLGEVSLGDAQLLHAQKNLTQERRAYMVDCLHLTISSRPVGYAAEHLTRGRFPAIPMGRFPLMSFCCILYHFPLLHVLLG